MSATATLPTEAPASVETRNAEPLTTRDERIRLRAYELYLARNGAAGDAEGDWFRAESEIVEKSADAAK